jgi:aquaporin Z
VFASEPRIGSVRSPGVSDPAVSIAFSPRGDFAGRRVPGYIAVQLVGASLAAWFAQSVINASATFGSNYPATGHTATNAFLMEAVLTLGLVSVILGTASGAQNSECSARSASAGTSSSPASGAARSRAHQ